MRKRDVIAPHKGDKRYARRDGQGKVTESQLNIGRCLAADRRIQQRLSREKGQADREDQKKANDRAGGDFAASDCHLLKRRCSFSQGRQFKTAVFSRPARRA
jgi:hypothetical protein